MTWCFTISKFILFCLNFLFVLIGLALVAVGAWAAADDKGFLDTIQFFSSSESIEVQLYQGTSVLRYFSYGVIVIGTLMVIVTFIGCWGVVSENRQLLIVFTSLVIAMVLIEGGGAAAMGGTIDRWTSDYENTITEKFTNNYVGTLGAFSISEFEPYSLGLDKLMIELECCGLQGGKDFENSNSRWYKEGRKYPGTTGGDEVKIPPACCMYTSKEFMKKNDYSSFDQYLKDQQCVKTRSQSNSNRGCIAAAKERIHEKGLPYIAIPIAIVVLQLVCIGLSIFLISRIKKWDEELYY
ncbi:unnamed protein product [Heterobilharzia americana]|nr:unnamed protein product [Heterobilharzia americana]